MKKIVVFLLMIASFTMWGCSKQNSFHYEIYYEDQGMAVDIDEFDISDIKLHIEGYGLDVYANVTSDMVSEEDLNSLKEIGSHEITISFNDFSGTVTVIIAGEEVVGNTFDMAYYSSAYGLGGDELKDALRSIISVTTHVETYAELRQDLAITDTGSQSGNILLFYSRKEVSSTWDGGITWSREHIWPQSKGWFTTSKAGADIHHIRPVASSENSRRGNKSYGVGTGYYEPTDNVKGDVARILFYLLVRYAETDSLYPVTMVAQSFEMLLDWNELDPVDSIEETRNEEAYSIQGNRNPFIDYSDYAYYIWDFTRLDVGVNDEFISFVNIYSFI